MTDKRKDNGQFAEGNVGGPGRPRRTVEADYLSVFSEVLTLDRWRAIVACAVAEAEGGNVKAREWLGKYAMGSGELREIAKHESLGRSVDEAIATEARTEEFVARVRGGW